MLTRAQAKALARARESMNEPRDQPVHEQRDDMPATIGQHTAMLGTLGQHDEMPDAPGPHGVEPHLSSTPASHARQGAADSSAAQQQGGGSAASGSAQPAVPLQTQQAPPAQPARDRMAQLEAGQQALEAGQQALQTQLAAILQLLQQNTNAAPAPAVLTAAPIQPSTVTSAPQGSIATAEQSYALRPVGDVHAANALRNRGLEGDPEYQDLRDRLSRRPRNPLDESSAVKQYWDLFLEGRDLKPSSAPYKSWKRLIQRQLRCFLAYTEAADIQMIVTDTWVGNRLKQLLPRDAADALKGLGHFTLHDFWRALDTVYHPRAPQLTLRLQSNKYGKQAVHATFVSHFAKNCDLWDEFRMDQPLTVHSYTQWFSYTHRPTLGTMTLVAQAFDSHLQREHVATTDCEAAGIAFMRAVLQNLDDQEAFVRDHLAYQNQAVPVQPNRSVGRNGGPAVKAAALTSGQNDPLHVPLEVWASMSAEDKTAHRKLQAKRKSERGASRQQQKPNSDRQTTAAAHMAPDADRAGAAEDPTEARTARGQVHSYGQAPSGVCRMGSFRACSAPYARPDTLMAMAHAAAAPRTTRASTQPAAVVAETTNAQAEHNPPAPPTRGNAIAREVRNPQRRAPLSKQGHDAASAAESDKLVAQQRQLQRVRELFQQANISDRVVHTVLKAVLPVTLLDLISCVKDSDISHALLRIGQTLENMRTAADLPPDAGPTVPSVAAAAAVVLGGHDNVEIQALGRAIAAAAYVPDSPLIVAKREHFPTRTWQVDFAPMRTVHGFIGADADAPRVRIAIDEGCELGAMRLETFLAVQSAWKAGFPPLHDKHGEPRLLHLDAPVDMVSFEGAVHGYRILAQIFVRIGCAVYPLRVLLMESAPSDIVLPLAYMRRFCVLPPDTWEQRRQDAATVLHLGVEHGAGLSLPPGLKAIPGETPATMTYAQTVPLDTAWRYQYMSGREIPAAHAEPFLGSAGGNTAGKPSSSLP